MKIKTKTTKTKLSKVKRDKLENIKRTKNIPLIVYPQNPNHVNLEIIKSQKPESHL